MKILLAHNSYLQAGGEDVVFDQERQLLERHGHRVITYVRSNREFANRSGVERAVMLTQIISAGDSKREILQILRAESPDLVHVHNTFLMISPSIFEACRDANVPVLQTLHNYRLLCPAATFYRDGHVCEECSGGGLWHSVWHGCYRESRPTTAAVALMLKVHRARHTWDESVSGYLALTEFARRKFINSGLPGHKVHVKPNFVFPDPGERTSPGDYAIFAGRLSEEKGVSTLLAAWEHLSKTIPLVIVGDGPLRKKLEQEAAARGLRDVTFRGWLSLRDTRTAIQQARFLIIPSVWYEAFALNIVESFACGTPVLCSRLGAMEENVADYRTGLHFTAGDAVDLARKVDWAWSHPARLAAMGREARREYETRYTAERNYSMLMKIYQQTVETYAS